MSPPKANTTPLSSLRPKNLQEKMTKAASLPQHPRRRRIIESSSDDESVKVVIGTKTDPNIRHQVRQDQELAEKIQNDLNNEREDLMWDEMDQDHDWQVAEKTTG